MLRKVLVSLVFLLLAGSPVESNTVIEWWQFWTDPAVRPTIQAMVDEFQSANPDIRVEVTDLTWANGHEKIVVAFASETAPDIVELGSDWIAQFAASGRLLDMSPYVGADSGEFQGWSMATYDDRIYAQPWILGTRILFCNGDLLDRAGLEPGFVPINWPDLWEAAMKVQRLGGGIYGWGSNTAEKHRLYKKFLPFFWSVGAQIFTDDGDLCVISSTYGVEALAFYKKLHDSCGFVGSQRQIEDAFLDGKIGFIISGDWLLKRISLENRSINLLSTFIPGPETVGKSFLGGEFLAVNKDSEHKEAAMKFVKFITSPENQNRFCRANLSANPSSKHAQEDSYFTTGEHLQTFIGQARFAQHPPVDPDWVYIEDVIEEAVEDALFGSGLPATALRHAQIKITQIKNRE